MKAAEPCVLGDEAGDGMWIDEACSLVITPFGVRLHAHAHATCMRRAAAC